MDSSVIFQRDFLGQAQEYAVGVGFDFGADGSVDVDYGPKATGLNIGRWQAGRLIGTSEIVAPAITCREASLALAGVFGTRGLGVSRLELVYDQGAIHLYAGTRSVARCTGAGWVTPYGATPTLRVVAAAETPVSLGPRSRLSPLAARVAGEPV